jgi:hypothetical protein
MKTRLDGSDEEKKPDQEQQTGDTPPAEPKADEEKAM